MGQLLLSCELLTEAVESVCMCVAHICISITLFRSKHTGKNLSCPALNICACKSLC